MDPVRSGQRGDPLASHGGRATASLAARRAHALPSRDLYGHASAEYLRSLKADLPLVYGRNSTAIPDEPAARNADRAVVEILAVGQAIRRKGFDIVIDAMAQLEDLPCRLTVVGEGEQREALARRAAGRGNVRVAGALPSDRILDAYRQADLFLFPTRSDVFGLVLVEAMGAGLATIASTSPGDRGPGRPRRDLPSCRR